MDSSSLESVPAEHQCARLQGKPMRILMVASGPKVPSTRFRMIPFRQRLIEYGHRCDIAFSFPPKYEYYRWLGWRFSQRLQMWCRRWQVHLAKRKRYDCIIIEREVFDRDDWSIETALRAITPRLVLDVDDGIFLRYPEKYQAITQLCDHILCGNPRIEEYTRAFNPSTTILPTCIDERRYVPRPQNSASTKPIVGWIGTGPNVRLLAICAPALRSLADSIRFRLEIIASPDAPLSELNLSGVDVQLIPWSETTEISHLHRFDLGIMPLPSNDPWMEFKCAAKLLQYLAVGIPAIATPIGVNEDILRHKVGFAASTQEEWAQALRALLDDASLRRTLGENGRKLVEQQYTLASNFPRFLEAIEGP